MLVTKFPYQQLSRKSVDGQRLYLCPDGSKLPSVTTVLDQTKSEEKKKALNNWRNRVGTDRAAAITKEAASRGTRMHTYLENYMCSGDMGECGTNPFSIESHKMAKCVINSGLCGVNEFYGSEVSLFHPELYAGSTDCVALYKGEMAIIDFKQTNRPKKKEWIEDYFLQLVAYAWAHNKLYDTDIRRGVIMMCSPDLNYQQFEVTPETFEQYSDAWWSRLYKYYEKKC
jgi:ATP-dependent exoDNAse (exonuclease V) beta subunit